MARIDPTARVSTRTQLGDDVEIGPYAIIEDNVDVGEGTRIGGHVFIGKGSRLGKECSLYHGAVVGAVPQDLKFKGEESNLVVGDRTVIREYCTISRGTEDRGTTEIGADCLLMAYVHVAHDCVIGDRVVLANCVNIAGHVVIEDYASLGGIVPVHQFVRIGRHSFIGGGVRVPKDVPPYILAAGDPLRYAGLNSVGLRRRGFDSDTLMSLKRVYRIIYRSNLSVSQALKKIYEEFEITPELEAVLAFIESSERGII